MKLKTAVLLVLFILAADAAMAERGHTTLLATSEPLQSGVTADLYLETQPGTGKIFIESSPLTKIDTQISTRFANEVACSYLGTSCNELDFFYTIKADAVIIGGPSAGAATAALTVAVLEGVELNESVAVTGTINSGNVIGHVGGILEKIEAASDAGIKKVLIPKGEYSFARNASIDPAAYGRTLEIEVVEVFSLDEAMMEFTGSTFQAADSRIDVDKSYSEVMEKLAADLCERTAELQITRKIANESFEEARLIALNLSNQGAAAYREGSHYAAASYCFGANVRYRFLQLLGEKPSSDEITENLNEVSRQIDEFESTLTNASTVSDAQILAIVKDRVTESRVHANQSAIYLNQRSREDSIFELAFATERLESAVAWSRFFGTAEETEITIEMLKNACVSKLGEAQERIEYTDILLLTANDRARSELGQAQRYLDENDYVQCLHKATTAKSEANTILSVYGARDSDVDEIVDRKIEAAKRSIARQQGIFPIVGYSYYEYADSLRKTDKYSALLFSDYALEFSSLDIYFNTRNATVLQRETKPADERESEAILLYFLGGFLLGIAITSVLSRFKGKKRKKRILIKKRR
ncbi:hypothetical protein HYX10_04090 [Candidatus Woesearchaeota archaeon]|nr:hypothetical protein [Candidatus Woesearchaeota archaeon]